jgi:hypothetical protein
MDFDEERDFADQGPVTDMDMEEVAEMLALMLKHNSHPTIPYRLKDDQRIGHASTDTQRDRGNGSRLYEVNIWMWLYGRAAPGWCLRLSPRGRGSGPSSSGRQRRGSIAARRQQQQGRPMAAADRIEHWPMISYVIS